MTCANCGYALSSFDKSCPRCSRIQSAATSGRPTSEMPAHSAGINPPSPYEAGTQNPRTNPPSPYPSSAQNAGTQHTGANLPSPYPSQGNAGGKNNNAILGWVIAGILGLALMSSLFRNNNQPTQVANQPKPVALAASAPVEAPQLQPPVRIGPSFNEVDAKMDDRLTDLTQAQKQNYWTSVSGSQVTWSGEVVEVEISSGGRLTLKCNPKSWGSDVIVTLDGSQADRLHLISKNQQITVRATLNEHSMFGYNLSQGHIVGL